MKCVGTAMRNVAVTHTRTYVNVSRIRMSNYSLLRILDEHPNPLPASLRRQLFNCLMRECPGRHLRNWVSFILDLLGNQDFYTHFGDISQKSYPSDDDIKMVLRRLDKLKVTLKDYLFALESLSRIDHAALKQELDSYGTQAPPRTAYLEQKHESAAKKAKQQELEIEAQRQRLAEEERKRRQEIEEHWRQIEQRRVEEERKKQEMEKHWRQQEQDKQRLKFELQRREETRKIDSEKEFKQQKSFVNLITRIVPSGLVPGTVPVNEELQHKIWDVLVYKVSGTEIWKLIMREQAQVTGRFGYAEEHYKNRRNIWKIVLLLNVWKYTLDNLKEDFIRYGFEEVAGLISVDDAKTSLAVPQKYTHGRRGLSFLFERLFSHKGHPNPLSENVQRAVINALEDDNAASCVPVPIWLSIGNSILPSISYNTGMEATLFELQNLAHMDLLDLVEQLEKYRYHQASELLAEQLKKK